MTTPKKEAIIEKAFEQWHKQNHSVSANTPELDEVKECGIYEQAKNELMRSEDSEYRGYIESEARSLGYELTKVKPSELAKQVVASDFEIDLEEVMKTGLAITGTSHSGKTNLAFVVADMLIREGVIVYAVDPSQAWLNSSIPNVLCLTYPEHIAWQDIAQSTIFDVSRLTVLEQKEFVEKLCKVIFEARVRSSHKPKTFIFFEEAHTYFPEGSMRSRKYQEALRIVTTGRNFNIRFGLITQWCALIDKTVLKFPRQKYFGYTDEKNDKEYLRNFIGNRVNELETLQIGEFIYDYGKTTKKIQVPLFQAKTKPKRLEIAQKPIPVSKPSHDYGKSLTSLIVALIWLFAILVASGQIR